MFVYLFIYAQSLVLYHCPLIYQIKKNVTLIYCIRKDKRIIDLETGFF